MDEDDAKKAAPKPVSTRAVETAHVRLLCVCGVLTLIPGFVLPSLVSLCFRSQAADAAQLSAEMLHAIAAANAAEGGEEQVMMEDVAAVTGGGGTSAAVGSSGVGAAPATSPPATRPPRSLQGSQEVRHTHANSSDTHVRKEA